MNPKKKDNNGWILCPSKSFPGKFYYFNVVNGEAAWSLNDADQKAMRKDTTLHEADKSHSFPEPLGPPAESPTTNCGPNILESMHKIVRSINNTQRTAIFGQATFPSYVSNVDPSMQNFIWAPMLPMFLKPWQSQETPFWDSRKEYVQACDIPLSIRFTNYVKPKISIFQPSMNSQVFAQSRQETEPVIGFSNISHSPIFGGMVHSSNTNDSIKKNIRPRTQSESDSVIGTFHDTNQIFDVGKDNVELKKNKRQRTLSESDSVFCSERFQQPKLVFKSNLENNSNKQNVSSETYNQPRNNFVLRKSVLNFNNPFQIKVAGHTENDEKENQNKKNVNDQISLFGNLQLNDWRENKKVDSLGNLDENDLRHTLVKRRRKSVDLGHMNHIEENQFKAPTIEKQKGPVKKKVKFDIDSTEESSGEKQDCYDDPPQVTIHSLRNLADRINGPWYIAVDCGVLLDDCDFIERFVKLDKDCRLFVPHVVRLAIEGYSFGDCRGQQRVIVARQLTRRLATPPQHIVVQPAGNEDNMFTKMSSLVRIMNCCIEILQQNGHVVLITDDTVLYERAKSFKIHCFKLKEIKDGAPTPRDTEPPFEITLKNKHIQTSFMEQESRPFTNNNQKNPVDNYKNTLFKNDNAKNTTDANTSPINFEETTDKSRDYLNFNYDSDSDGTIISKTMEKLIIKDKNCNFLHNNSNDVRKSNSFTFPIKNKNNTVPQTEQKNCQLLNSKKESVFREPKQNLQFQIQTKVDGQKEVQTANKCEEFSRVEQFKKTIEKKLKENFKLKSKFMEENIRINIDEWICTFRQIMEYYLSESLQSDPSPPVRPPPWSLSEAVRRARAAGAARAHWRLAAAADQLSLMLLNNCCKRGELKHDIAPGEFLRVFGCGVILLELLPSSDGHRLLRDMYTLMLRGNDNADLVDTPVVCKDDGEEPVRHNVPKKSSDIIEYLKRHFPAWKNYVGSPHDEVITQHDKKIVRTFGRHLNLLTIDKSKSMTLREPPAKANDQDLAMPSRQSSEEHTLIHSQSTVKLNEPKMIGLFDTSTPVNKDRAHTIDMSLKHGNTFNDATENGPKVVRNIKLIDEYEKKLNYINEEFKQNSESFSLSDVSLCSSLDKNYDKNDSNNDKKSLIDNYKAGLENYGYDDTIDKNSFNDAYREQNNDLDKPNDSSTNDSGFVNEIDTFTVVQTFLSELSVAMKSIYSFIDVSMEEFRKKELDSDKKKFILDKATVTHLHLSGIIYKLKRIVQRESDEVTPLKEIILKADIMMAGDIRLMKYRQVVIKCLEQAQFLESSLKMLLAITEGHYDVASCTDKPTFFNIFE